MTATRQGPLSGVRVLDFTTFVSGPFATMILADLGAQIVKVERMDGGDDARSLPPLYHGVGCYFADVNRNKTSIAIDLKCADGQSLARHLAASSDVVVENFRPGVMQRLGLDYPVLSKDNAGLVYCSISAYEQASALRDQPGYDPIIQAATGIMMATGEEGRPPVRIGPSIVDKGAGFWAALSVLAALLRRASDGVGQHLEVSLFGAGVSWMSYDILRYVATGEMPLRRGSAGPGGVPQQAFAAADGFVHVAVGNDRLWQRFCVAIDRADLGADSRYETVAQRVNLRESLIPELERLFVQKPRDFWIARLKEQGVPCAPVNTVVDLVESDKDLSDFVLDVPGPFADSFTMIASPLLRTFGGADEVSQPPVLGQGTREVLSNQLGLADAEIDALIDNGTVR